MKVFVFYALYIVQSLYIQKVYVDLAIISHIRLSELISLISCSGIQALVPLIYLWSLYRIRLIIAVLIGIGIKLRSMLISIQSIKRVHWQLTRLPKRNSMLVMMRPNKYNYSIHNYRLVYFICIYELIQYIHSKERMKKSVFCRNSNPISIDGRECLSHSCSWNFPKNV